MSDLLYSFFMMMNGMSPYILLGFLMAGVLHAFVPSSVMGRHLSGCGVKQVVKGALIGVPLPLCSCGVLPTAVSLRRSGASRAASSSFLIATPQTGVDSIAATYALLGPAFAVIRPVAALATSMIGGLAVGKFERTHFDDAGASGVCSVPSAADEPRHGFVDKVKDAFRYGFYDLVRSLGGWLMIGLVVAALINVFVPADFFASFADKPVLAMLMVVIVAVPMYVCATGSIPIAMSLMLKGLSPGTALVLLMAGPAANFASISIISRSMGRWVAAIYVTSIVAGSMAFGLLIDYMLPHDWFVIGHDVVGAHGGEMHVSLFATICSVLLIALLVVAFVLPKLISSNKDNMDMNKTIRIKGMSCPHCQASVEKGISALPGVKSVKVDLRGGEAMIDGDVDMSLVAETIRNLGFDPVV